MRILITGSRNWTDPLPIRRAIEAAIGDRDPRTVTFVHGAARGADSLGSWVATDLGCIVESHPADWDKHGNAAGPRRNIEMADLGADVCLAFPRPESRGTHHMIRVCNDRGIRVEEAERHPEWFIRQPVV